MYTRQNLETQTKTNLNRYQLGPLHVTILKLWVKLCKVGCELQFKNFFSSCDRCIVISPKKLYYVHLSV
jgi:hypothetical protein